MHKNEIVFCPICEYPVDQCQCMFAGDAHPDRSKKNEVARQHLYFFTPEEQQHIINLEKEWECHTEMLEKCSPNEIEINKGFR